MSGHYLDEFAVLYDEAFRVGGALPDEVDRQSLFAVAAMLGRNRAEERPPWPEDAPDILTVRRHYYMTRGERPPKRDVPIDDDEYHILLAQVTGGKRRG